MPIARLVVTIPDAAEMLSLNPYTVWRMVYARRIESIKIGKSRRIRVEEINKLLDNGTIPARRK
jgi:excisionase family DNA binding protein